MVKAGPLRWPEGAFEPMIWYQVRLKRISDILCRKNRVSSLRRLLSARSLSAGQKQQEKQLLSHSFCFPMTHPMSLAANTP